MNPLFAEFLATIARWALTSIGAYLVTHHALTADQADRFSNALVEHVLLWAPSGLALFWALLAKYRSRVKFLTALDAPPGTTEQDVKAQISEGGGASISTKAALLLAIGLLFASPVNAQTTTEKAADSISTGLVGANIAADVVHDVRHHCVKNLLIRNGLTIGAAELTKLFVHERRPDGSDEKSFYSEHSALSMANYGWSYKIGFSIALGAGAGRVVAKKHHPTDVLVGLAAGVTASYFFPCEEK